MRSGGNRGHANCRGEIESALQRKGEGKIVGEPTRQAHMLVPALAAAVMTGVGEGAVGSEEMLLCLMLASRLTSAEQVQEEERAGAQARFTVVVAKQSIDHRLGIRGVHMEKIRSLVDLETYLKLSLLDTESTRSGWV